MKINKEKLMCLKNGNLFERAFLVLKSGIFFRKKVAFVFVIE